MGLGLPTIFEAFNTPLNPYDFILKLLFTAVTLGAGYKGGEVTPLFFIGATLGNALSGFIPLPMYLLAAIGFVSVFAGSTKTPLGLHCHGNGIIRVVHRSICHTTMHNIYLNLEGKITSIRRNSSLSKWNNFYNKFNILSRAKDLEPLIRIFVSFIFSNETLSLNSSKDLN